MTTRVLPEFDRFASCPLDGKVLEYYAGTFEAVYVSLNPFIKAEGIDTALFQPGTYPTFDDLVMKCKPVTWSEVARLAGLPSIGAVDVALRTAIRGLKNDLQNDAYAAAIETLVESHRTLSPTEGLFPELLYERVLLGIRRLGYDWLWVGDEFCTERKLRWIDELRQEGDELTKGRFNLFTPDKKVLWTIHWDSHFSFLCSMNDVLTAIVLEAELEGFFCTPSTEVYWSVCR